VAAPVAPLAARAAAGAPSLAPVAASSSPRPAPRAAAPAAGDEPPPWLDVPAADDDVPWSAEEPTGSVDWDDVPAPRRAAASPRQDRQAPPASVRQIEAGDPRDDDGGRDEPARDTPATPADTRPVLQPTALGERWDGVVQQMMAAGTISALVRELAVQGQCVAIDEGAKPPVWRLVVERDMLRAAVHADKLQTALRALLDQPVVLDLLPGVATDTPALRATAERDRRQRAAEETIHNDPLVKALLAQFSSARVVPGSIHAV
jgi:DNA polymerase-3 subunit gamma/tau